MRKNTWRQSLITHRPCLFFQKVFGSRLAISLNMPKGLRIAVFSVCLQSRGEFSTVIGGLHEGKYTKGLEVVRLQKVVAVGLMLGGNFDL